jgi:uncharacterized protein YdhG (YjbR/CyaY superfamily)
MPAAPKDFNDYIAGFPPKVRTLLRKVRATIRKAAPGAEEKISYRIPAFALHGNIAYFAAFKNHIGFYPPVRDPKLKREAAAYAGEKGNLRFALDEPIPYPLIERIVKSRVRENRAKAAAKKMR